MSEVQVNMGIIVAVGCFFITIAGVISAYLFAKKHGDSENIGTILSICVAAPFFFSLCYLLACIMGKVGETI